MNFSRHLAIIYTLIIAVPLMILVFVASEYLRFSLYDSLSRDAQKTVSDDASHVELAVEQIERLESIIISDYDLLRTFYYSGEMDEDLIIETMRANMQNLERLQFAMPQVYALHIFVRNPYIPERWPIVFRESRLDFSHIAQWTYNYQDPVMGNIESSKEPSVCLTNELLLSKQHVGYVQVSMKMPDFFPFLGEKKADTNEYVFFADNLVTPQLKNAGALFREAYVKRHDSTSGVFMINIEKENSIAAYTKIPGLNLLLIRTSPTAGIARSIFMIRLGAFAVLFASIAIMFFIITLATKKMVNRLYLVIDGMKKIREGNLDVYVQVSGNDEVTEMAETFTQMVVRLNTLVTQIKDEQALVTQTEIKAMQNQINAHFLYNVLETIKMQAELKDQKEIAESITLLGKMMRYCLRWRTHRVLLSQEIEYIYDYIRLMNIRNDYVISLSVHIAQVYFNKEIPKMLIQPVVENAVLHALEPLGDNGVIDISAIPDEQSGVLWIIVSDSGTGMDSAQIDSLGKALATGKESESSSGGIGLINIQQRLHAFYGKEYTLGLESSPGQGTIVRIPVPLEVS